MAPDRTYTSTHTAGRLVTYAFLWLTAATLMGLTAYRIHITESLTQGYESIVAELLAASVITILWVPIAIFLAIAQRAGSTTHRQNTSGSSGMHSYLLVEMAGNFVLWVMFLVGSAYFTNRILPGRRYCLIRGKNCNTLASILAFSWIAFSLLTILGVYMLMQYSSAGTSITDNNPTTEKSRNGATVTTGSNNAGNLNAPNQPLV